MIMPTSKTCYMLIGIPGSGKTTFYNQTLSWDIQKETPACGDYVASTDNIIEHIAIMFDLTYDDCFRDLYPFAEKVMYKNIEQWTKKGLTFTWDQTNISMKSRGPKIRRLKNQGYRVVAVWFDVPEWKELDKRLRSRKGKNIPKDVIQSMINNFEFPELVEGFDDIIKG